MLCPEAGPQRNGGLALTIPSSCTHDRGISASMSITLDMDAGMASCVGAAGVGAACGAGRDAARAAAMDVTVAISIFQNFDPLKDYGASSRRKKREREGNENEIT